MITKNINEIITNKRKDIWAYIVSKPIYDETKLEIKDNVATIYTKDQIYANELKILNLHFLNKIQEYEKNVTELKIKVYPKKFIEEKKVITTSERNFKAIMQEKREIAKKIFKDVKDEETKKYFIASLSIKLIKDEYLIRLGAKKCKKCSEYFIGKETLCPVCLNENIKIEVGKIINLFLKDPYLTKEYITKIYKYSELAYNQAKNEILRKLYIKLVESFKKHNNNNGTYNEVEKNLDTYVRYKINTENETILEIEKKHILKNLNSLFLREKNNEKN